jgi:transcriptional regulator, XRE family
LYTGAKVNELSSIIGLKIRQKRQENGINQEKLALLAEIDRSYMGRIERGEVNITLEKLYRLCEVLECEAADLLPLRAELAV